MFTTNDNFLKIKVVLKETMVRKFDYFITISILTQSTEKTQTCNFLNV